MQDKPKPSFPRGSLLASMFGEGVPIETRRAARRLRAEGVPAVAADDEIVGLAAGLAASEISRLPVVIGSLPPLFWLEATQEGASGAPCLRGWAVEKKRGGLVAKGFRLLADQGALPEAGEVLTLRFGTDLQDQEDDESRLVRGLVSAVCLPEMMAEMGENSPVAVLPAEAPEADADALRGFRLSVAMSAELDSPRRWER